MATPCAAFSSQGGRGFSHAARIGSDFTLTPPARSQQPLSPGSPRPLAARRSPHPAAKRFVQEAFRIGFAMRKALSIWADPQNGLSEALHTRNVINWSLPLS